MSKQQILWAAALCVVLVGSYYFLFFVKEGTQPLTGSEESSILLFVEEGDVSYKSDSMESFQKATSSSMVISNNTHVHTGLGRATVLFPNNSSVALDQYTELLVTYEADKISLLQTLGTTYHRVEALVSGSTYEVETPGTLAAVRGTKFAVRYDKKTKTAKVAVTEHAVLVSRFKTGVASSTKEILESLTLEEGKTARIQIGSETKAIDIVETDADADMKAWVDKNKERDTSTDLIRKDSNLSSAEIRIELKNTFERRTESDPSKDESAQEPMKNEASVPPKETRTKTESTAPSQPASGESNVTNKTETGSTIKIDEETFFNKFNDLYTKYFYLDEHDSPCDLNVVAAERARAVSLYASGSGYAFGSGGLLEFAQAIDTYCGKKDTNVKAALKLRFDTEYPFQEDI